jgi:MFS family permease
MAMAKPDSKVNGSLLAIIAEGFLSRLSFGIIGFALPLYARHLGFTLAEIGFLMALNSVVAIALKPAMGWLADRIGLKEGYVVALAVRSLVPLLLAFAGQPWQVYAARVVGGTADALRDPTSSGLIAERSAKKRVASAYAWYATSKSTAGALGKAMTGFILTLTASNYLWVFGMAFVASVLPTLAVARFMPSSAESSQPGPGPAEGGRASDVAEGPRERVRIGPAMAFGFLVAGTAHMLHGLFPVLAVEYAGLSAAETGLLYLVSTIVILCAGPAFGWLSDHVSRTLVLTVRSVANTVSSAIYLFSPTLAGFLVGKAVDDAGKAAFHPAWGSLMAQISAREPHKRGRMMALMRVSEDAGSVTAPIVAGLLWNAWGVGALLGARIGIAIVAELYTLLWFRRGMHAEPLRGETTPTSTVSPAFPPATAHAPAEPPPAWRRR